MTLQGTRMLPTSKSLLSKSRYRQQYATRDLEQISKLLFAFSSPNIWGNGVHEKAGCTEGAGIGG